jgi:ABC-type antimicrobial peptide transport system permease subunit
MALGAERGDVLRLVIRQALGLVAIGLAIGMACAGLLTRSIEKLLFGVKATDPATFAGVAVLFAVIGMVACYVPARRATRVDPLVALRYE